ncbi:MAG: S-methyl-5'-thioadenosine phosphorylase [Thermosynechococcus sp.]|uniref:S-methyl-5'-thioadenosine phosphorylase n=1 Tax=Thermosynechococcus sp. TaxID=2814275 RepID=UPI00220FBBDF|nr:S-methyl-5'-thioadenosine phosphorylase [Thermosynechococcus sp.]BCX13042.1 MAG: S-methyl-5'-thioadenosine phosphorylase [Thermosynechococcus sp.]
MTAKIGIIGGSGLYKMDALTDVEEVRLTTPFGDPSDAFICGKIAGVPVVFLARHGRHHHLLPTEIPFRANIYGFKSLGVEYLLSASAVGSLQEAVKPLDIVVPDQFIDRTRNRISTFFGDGIVAHIGFADPVCPALAGLLADAIADLNLPDVTLHRQGTYVCMEGPAFSTLAESNLYRSWGGTVIGMTNLPEAKLAREAEIAYATLALVTDYDCWHPEHDSVTVEMIMGHLQRNVKNAQAIICETVKRVHAHPPVSKAHRALQNAILTPLDKVPTATKEKLHLLLAKYL